MLCNLSIKIKNLNIWEDASSFHHWIWQTLSDWVWQKESRQMSAAHNNMMNEGTHAFAQKKKKMDLQLKEHPKKQSLPDGMMRMAFPFCEKPCGQIDDQYQKWWDHLQLISVCKRQGCKPIAGDTAGVESLHELGNMSPNHRHHCIHKSKLCHAKHTHTWPRSTNSACLRTEVTWKTVQTVSGVWKQNFQFCLEIILWATDKRDYPVRSASVIGGHECTWHDAANISMLNNHLAFLAVNS